MKFDPTDPQRPVEINEYNLFVLRANPLNADPVPASDLKNGDIWYRGDLDVFRGKVNGIVQDLSLTNETRLERVDTGASETAQVGVEYVSPEQQGGFFGSVRRKYFRLSGPITAGDTQQIAHGSTITEVVLLRGMAILTNGSFLPMNAGNETNNTFGLQVRIAGVNIEILSGSARTSASGFRPESGFVVVDYV